MTSVRHRLVGSLSWVETPPVVWQCKSILYSNGTQGARRLFFTVPKEYAPKAEALIKSAGGRFLAIEGVAGAGAGKVTGIEGEVPQRATLQV